MKLVDYLLKLWLRRARYRWSRLRRNLCEGRYLSTELPSVNSLKDIETCLRQVTWTMDGPLHLFDSISYPETVWAKKRDDCDGFAVLAAKLLNQWSRTTMAVLITAMVRPMRKSHTVCAFKRNGVLWFFDNYLLRREDCQTYADVVAKFTQEVDIVICWDVAKADTLETLEFHQA